MMPKVSVNFGSCRPGGLDISFYGLAHQTYPNYEVVFTDARYHERHERVLDEWASTGCKAPLYHIPNHRYNDTGMWQTPSSGYNTGYMLSDGAIVIMLMDYAYVHPTWVEEHVQAHLEARRVVMSPHEYRVMPIHEISTIDNDPRPVISFERENLSIEDLRSQRLRFDEFSIFKNRFTPKMLEGIPRTPERDVKELRNEGHQDGPDLPMHHKNESFRLEDLLAINGADERFDCGAGPGDPEMAFRLWLSGCDGWTIFKPRAICLDPRGILPNGGNIFSVFGKLPEWDYKWLYEEGNKMYEGFKASCRRLADNPYSLREKRKEIWHWRELSQQRDPVIPKNVVPDREYFKYLGIFGDK